MELEGRTALVTGGSRGIGLTTATLLKAAGSRVLVAARDSALLRELEASGLDCVAADLGKEADVARLVSTASQRFGDVPDIVVHSAGAFELSLIAETSIESFDRQISINLRAAFLLMRAVLPAMLGRRSGHVVSIGSVAGRQAFPANGAYSASKFGLRGLHEVLAAEVRGTGVRATLIEPAATDTELWDTVDRQTFSGLPPREAMLPTSAVAQAVLYAVIQPPHVMVSTLSVERS